MLFNQMKNENSRFDMEPKFIDLSPEGGFVSPVYDKNFFKTPLQVNNCVESLHSIDFRHENYGALVVASSLLSSQFLLQSIREKGGAYGAGCKANESGVFSFYSYRDPKVEQTFENFEQGLAAICEGDFTQKQLDEAKLLAFQQIDKPQEPSLKGLISFTRSYTDKERLKMRLSALNAEKQLVMDIAEKHLMSQLESGKTNRVVFGNQNENLEKLAEKKW